MSIKTVIKNNPLLRSLGKKINIYKAFYYDAKDFSNNFIESAEKHNSYGYSIMLLVHSLEKGMCMKELRPFGAQKVSELIWMMKSYSKEKKSAFEYQLALSVLTSWKEFYELHGWQNEKGYKEVCAFLITEEKAILSAGYRHFQSPISEFDFSEFESILLSRHSVRDFQDRELKMEDIHFAVKCFIEAPTACNRQMCKIYYIRDQEIKGLLDKVIIGVPGFNKPHTSYFVITYDLAAFAYSGERQQGMFNAGLCTMNFINGLHAKGIGSCCLQWSNKHSEDVLVRNKLGLVKSERIGIVVGAGYYLDNSIIPCSVRRRQLDVFRVI